MAFLMSACRGAESVPAATGVTPIYDQQTGKLDQLVSDRDGNGQPDAWAHMDGAVVKSIDVDRDGDGKADRWEHYAPGSPGDTPRLERVEESRAPDGRITRQEFYADGQVGRVEEDTDLDGHVDKWEYHENGRLSRVELDVQKKGFPDRRLVYGAAGGSARIEVDPDGDGVFAPLNQADGK
jgi:hypothetical protein